MKTEAQKRATAKYDSNNYDKITLLLRKDKEPTREAIKAAAAACGMSLNAYIMQAITEKIEKQ